MSSTEQGTTYRAIYAEGDRIVEVEVRRPNAPSREGMTQEPTGRWWPDDDEGRADAAASIGQWNAEQATRRAACKYGWDVWMTGGNCRAYGKVDPAGGEWLLTTLDGGLLPTSTTEAVWVGHYDANGDSTDPGEVPLVYPNIIAAMEAVASSQCTRCGDFIRTHDDSPDADHSERCEYVVDPNARLVEGMRVRLGRAVERYPLFTAPAGLAGEVVEVSPTLVLVRLDEPVAGMEEWDNELQFTRDDSPTLHGSAVDAAMRYIVADEGAA